MIKVNKDFKNLPASFKKKKCIAVIEKCLKESKYVQSDWYKTDEIKEQLKKVYNNKCAYCEGQSAAQSPFQVEHYRPENSPKENSMHPGYYWLAYEWSNLLWSCFWCNNYKKNQFPLEGEKERVQNPPLLKSGKLDHDKCKANSAELINEEPLLLNPEIDDRKKNLYFLPNGAIKGYTKKGKATIEICKLDRLDLIVSRKAIVDDFKEEIDLEIRDFLKGEVKLVDFKKGIKKIIARIYKRQLPHKPYSKLSYFMFDKFNQFFVNNIAYDNDTKYILRNTHEEYKKELRLNKKENKF